MVGYFYQSVISGVLLAERYAVSLINLSLVTYLTNHKDAYLQDGAEPASNSVSAMNLVRLYKLTGDPTYRARAEQLFRLFSSR